MVEGTCHPHTHSTFAGDVSIDGAKLAGCCVGDGEQATVEGGVEECIRGCNSLPVEVVRAGAAVPVVTAAIIREMIGAGAVCFTAQPVSLDQEQPQSQASPMHQRHGRSLTVLSWLLLGACMCREQNRPHSADVGHDPG